jgi:ornithine decarboxylase
MKDKTIDFLLKNKSKWGKKSPCFIVDEKKLTENIKSLKKYLKGEIAYSHKTNPDPLIIKNVYAQGCNFLVSSLEELISLVKLTGISPERIVFQSPSLTREQYKKIRKMGVFRFSIDSYDQLGIVLRDLKKNGHKMELMVRVNTGLKVHDPELPYGMDSFLGFPLVEAEGVLKKLNQLKKKGLIKIGIHNHLISQNTYLDMWKKNLQKLSDFVTDIKKKGILIDIVNFGGGYPIEYHEPVPKLQDISKLITSAQKRMLEVNPQMHFIFEPGRKTVGESVTLVAKVVHTKEFLGQNVAILNCSLYNCSLDTLIVGLYLPVKKIHNSPDARKKIYILRGSTPDSLDVFARGVSLPELKNGDYLAFLRCGAYSFGCDFISLPRAKCLCY